MIKTIIVDDHCIFRQGLIGLLQPMKDIKVVGEAADGKTALDMAEKLHADVMILDISMPQMSGFDVFREIKQRKLPTKVVFLTMVNDPKTIATALKEGVSAYVPKENAFDDLIYAVRSAAQGQQFISPSLTSSLQAYLTNRERAQNVLSPREKEILKLIVEGLSSRQIAEKLFICTKTVDNHREHIMQKLDIHKNVELVRYAISHNLV